MIDWKLQSRREFMKYLLGTGVVSVSLPILGREEWLNYKETERITILYTNDQHSRIEPFPQTDAKYPGEGGFAKRAAVIEKIRQEGNHVLLLDAGDIFQGTPYFNYFKGELEYKLMTKMGYDAVTLGNHDFDLGTENLVKQAPHAGFDFIISNYNMANSNLNGLAKYKKYKVFKKGHVRIGVLGLGIELNNLVAQKNYEGVVYENPVSCANQIANTLKYDEKCDYIICLSHLGFKYDFDKISDVKLAEQTEHIDLIIGGHTHTFLEEPVWVTNKKGCPVQVVQVGWAGIWLGRTDLYFLMHKRKMLQNSYSCKVN